MFTIAFKNNFFYFFLKGYEITFWSICVYLNYQITKGLSFLSKFLLKLLQKHLVVLYKVIHICVIVGEISLIKLGKQLN